MIHRRWFRAGLLALAAAGLAGLLQWLGLALPLALGLASLLFVVAACLPQLGVVWLDAAIDALRALIWRHEQGRHHAFNGVLLDIQDDGRHVWIAAEGVQQLLGSSDSDARLQARHAGRTRRDEKEQLLLRVDALVEHLQSSTTRRDPSRLRLLHYLERDVLFPAAERRRRSERMD